MTTLYKSFCSLAIWLHPFFLYTVYDKWIVWGFKTGNCGFSFVFIRPLIVVELFCCQTVESSDHTGPRLGPVLHFLMMSSASSLICSHIIHIHSTTAYTIFQSTCDVIPFLVIMLHKTQQKKKRKHFIVVKCSRGSLAAVAFIPPCHTHPLFIPFWFIFIWGHSQ